MLSVLLFAAGATLLPAAPPDSPTHFSCTLPTTAPPAAVWAVWTDVSHWPSWDSGLRQATLDGPWALHVTGRLTPDEGPAARFRVVAYEAGQRYTLRTRLPLGALLVHRRLEQRDGQTYFTHEVEFTGLSKGLFARVLGRRYRAMLPQVLQTVRQQAEARSVVAP